MQHIPEIYLCTMDCGRLRAALVDGSTTTLGDYCEPCGAAWDEARAAERTRTELLDLVHRLADTDARGADLTRLLQIVVGWPELASELAVRLVPVQV